MKAEAPVIDFMGMLCVHCGGTRRGHMDRRGVIVFAGTCDSDMFEPIEMPRRDAVVAVAHVSVPREGRML